MTQNILTTILFLTFSFQSFAHEPVIYVDSSAQEISSSFPESYKNSRDRFIQFFENKKLKAEMTRFKVPSLIDQDLTTDVAYVPAKNKKKLVILMTGVHGGEAYAANAVMSEFMQNELSKHLGKNVGFVFVHALNPYGFKYFRRSTENNIDLNRNFPTPPDVYATNNEAYKEVRGLLVEEAPLNTSSFHNKMMLPRVGLTLIAKPAGFLVKATAGGQYHDDKGLFYGGTKPEPQIAFINEYLKKVGSPYQDILYVDLHTGYGQNGVLHLFGNVNLLEKHKTFTEKVFQNEKIDYGSDKDFYKTSGDSVAFMSTLFPDKNVASMCFEFGTLDSHKTLGSFKSLQTLRFETQGAVFGFENNESQKKSREMSIRMFAPQDAQWREKVLSQGKEKLNKALEYFLNL